MSVLACDRKSCEKIMCDRLILDGSAYICNDCFDELVASRSSWPKMMPLDEVRERIEAFMQTEPHSTKLAMGIAEIEAEFRRLVGR